MTSVAMPNTIAVCHGPLATASAQATISALSAAAQAPAQMSQSFGDHDHPRNVAGIRAHGYLCSRAGIKFDRIKRSMDSSVTHTARPAFTKSKCLRFRNQSRSVDGFTPSLSAALLKRTNLCISLSLRLESIYIDFLD